MEPIYLLFSILSTCITSFTLSLILVLSLLLQHVFPHLKRSNVTSFITLYDGTVWHERRSPVHHSFEYSVRYALMDLDHARNFIPDCLSAQEARSIANGPVFLLTIPHSVGYEQNPMRVYYCYEIEGSTTSINKCIGEATNTPWGERVQFLFNINSDMVAKPLHLSPFMDMLGSWSIRTTIPGEHLSVSVSVKHPKQGDYFTASYTAKRISSPSIPHALFFWLTPHKVAILIYWQALKVWWKKVAFIQHPRHENSSYREEVMARDRNLRLCQAFTMQTKQYQKVELSSDSKFGSDMNKKDHRLPLKEKNDRWFRWIDAKWPWC